MKEFRYKYSVHASLKHVSHYYMNSQVIKKMTPPPVWIQIHQAEPLAEGSRSEFTMWFGPFPVRWIAIHENVDPIHGFTDVQVKGLMQTWIHSHQFHRIDDQTTLIKESIKYEHPSGIRGLITRILFSPLFLKFLFMYRQWVLTRELSGSTDQDVVLPGIP